VRELENAIERAIVMGTTQDILPEDLPEAILEAKALEISTSETGYHESVTGRKKQAHHRGHEEISRAALPPRQSC
jgi:DNA-binding NtrC family response regulator